jgi:streptomycin 3"-adenylyltransferase
LSSVGWNSCPDETKQQIQHLLVDLTKQLESNLMGVYLHGSLALGCFNPRTSDIDLLVLTDREIPLLTKKALVHLLLSISGIPHPIEISFLSQGNLTPWKYPTPFEFHYSEGWRERFNEDLATGSWKQLCEQPQTDTDLAAHITVTRHRGICLWGAPLEKIFPDVPPKDFLASILSDLEWTLERLDQISVTGILNSCRVYAYLQERRICSKD